MKKIVHMTSAHSRFDDRIFYKMCLSLVSAGYDVFEVVADGKRDEKIKDVKIFDVGKSTGRLLRMLKSSALVYKKALKLSADIYHIHDPELLPYALLLKLKGKRVVFDSHEDVPRQILSKPYLNKTTLKFISLIFEKIENYIIRRLDFLIGATPYIRDIFKKLNPNSIDIDNYPVKDELSSETRKELNMRQICYVGGITPTRGIYENVEAMGLITNVVTLVLAGNFSDGIKLEDISKNKGFQRVKSLGFLSRDGIRKVLSESFAGLVTLHPIVNYIEALPIKMFEYMQAGIAVIASNFPLWKEIVEGNQCGICVDPLKPEEIAKAIDYLYEHPDEANKMGENGRKAILEKYNWSIEEKKLLQVYEKVLNS